MNIVYYAPIWNIPGYGKANIEMIEIIYVSQILQNILLWFVLSLSKLCAY